MTFRKQFGVFLVCVLVAGVACAADPYSAEVVGIAGGDTITVVDSGQKQHQIRLHGINAPRRAQAFDAEAKQFTSDACLGKTVAVTVVNRDHDGWEVATVMLPNGNVLNQKIVAAGFAWSSPGGAPKDKTLDELQKRAREGKLGLWADANATPPWEWRHSGPGDAGGDRRQFVPRTKTFTFYNPVTAKHEATTDPNVAAQYLSKGWMLESAQRTANTNRPNARIQRSTDAD